MKNWCELTVERANKAAAALPYIRDGIRIEICMIRRLQDAGCAHQEMTKERIREMWSEYRHAASLSTIMKGQK